MPLSNDTIMNQSGHRLAVHENISEINQFNNGHSVSFKVQEWDQFQKEVRFSYSGLPFKIEHVTINKK